MRRIAMSSKTVKRIPYGLADYGRMKADNSYYVDKTHFIPLIEASPYFLFFIRPRRFGKSLWLSVLQHYYDINKANEFKALFSDTYIGKNPTEERNSYLVMFLNFALVNPDIRYVEESFAENTLSEIEAFLKRYQSFFTDEEYQDVLSREKPEDQLRQIFLYTSVKGLKTFLIIDEYDNFSNTILTTTGQEAYHNLTHGGGFFRYFFNLLKGVTAGQISGLTRLFITGVSPITMDDVSSGFNIGNNISLDSRFNEMVGFTEAEVLTMLSHYYNAGELPLSVDKSIELMQEWYNNYRFGKNAGQSMFNSDMVLYFILKATREKRLPDHLIDQNVRIDYGKLRHLITVDKRLNGNFSELKSIIETGEVISDIALSFPLEHLLQRENFISLLFYFGLLTFAGEKAGRPLLRVPNLTIKDLMYGYIREGFTDVDIFRLDIWKLANLLGDMAYKGEWQAVFDFLAEEIKKQTSIRDYLNGEKVIQGFLLAYLNVTHFFLLWSEKEMGGGFADLYLEPFLARYPDMQYGYLIELKYIPRKEFNEVKLQEVVSAAKLQLEKYANDARIQDVASKVPVKKLVLVYKGWELVHREEEIS